LDEERRLFYVAMTRARDELWLTHHVAAGRDGRGRRRPSPFIAEALDAPSSAAQERLDAIATIDMFGAPSPATASAELGAHPESSFSYSELEEYLDCGERYRLRHVVGLPTPAHHALAYGSAMHQAVAAFHVSTGRGAPLDEQELLDVFARAWSPEGFLSREHEERRFAAGREAMLRFRRDQLAAKPEVVAIERPFTFRLGDLSIRGRMDRVDRTHEGDVVVDYKSSDVREQARADERARDSLQLQVYAMAHEQNAGSLPSQVRLHFLDSGVIGSAIPEPARLERARTKLLGAADGIRSRKFVARPSAVTCGYCPFRQICSFSAA
ncbi:MAG TPA: PD-(D/E)XK nuclease family protein, partial [Chloroflexota bacterium]|nr:PD-(D/E)XK nuclease family protein [Chloroflexota bacterium]